MFIGCAFSVIYTSVVKSCYFSHFKRNKTQILWCLNRRKLKRYSPKQRAGSECLKAAWRGPGQPEPRHNHLRAHRLHRQMFLWCRIAPAHLLLWRTAYPKAASTNKFSVGANALFLCTNGGKFKQPLTGRVINRIAPCFFCLKCLQC